MDKAWKKTTILVGVALVLGLAALATRPSAVRPELFNDQGQEFFPDFKDPLDATSLEVTRFDEKTGEGDLFKVELKEGIWTLPSHYSYPADGKDHLAAAARSLIGMKKDLVVSDNVAEQQACGVVDPQEGAVVSAKGIGERVVIRDAKDKALADFILGNEVQDKPDYRYIRLPGKKRIYQARVDFQLSMKFEDWIKPDLLDVPDLNVKRIIFNFYSVDPMAGTVKTQDFFSLVRLEDGKGWSLLDAEGKAIATPDGKEMDGTSVDQLLTALREMRIVGVRPKPENIAKLFRGEINFKMLPAQQQGVLLAQAQTDLAQTGFYLTAKPTPEQVPLWANQGEITVEMKDGQVYRLSLGDLVVGAGDELSSGKKKEKKNAQKTEKSEAEAKSEEAKDDKATPDQKVGRYLMVQTRFDESLVPTPEKPAAAPEKSDEAKAEAKTDAEKPADEYAKKLKEREDQIKATQAKVKKMNARYSVWYYVIGDEKFGSLHLARDKFFRDKAVEKKMEEKSGVSMELPGIPMPAEKAAP